MTMLAIELSEKNFDLAATAGSTSVCLCTRKEMVYQYNSDLLGEGLYFIPNYVLKGGYDSRGWQVIEKKRFLQEFDADMTKITTEFVEITRK